MDAHGVRRPDVTQVWASGGADVGLFKNGIKIAAENLGLNQQLVVHRRVVGGRRADAGSAPYHPPCLPLSQFRNQLEVVFRGRVAAPPLGQGNRTRRTKKSAASSSSS